MIKQLIKKFMTGGESNDLMEIYRNESYYGKNGIYEIIRCFTLKECQKKN